MKVRIFNALQQYDDAKFALLLSGHPLCHNRQLMLILQNMPDIEILYPYGTRDMKFETPKNKIGSWVTTRVAISAGAAIPTIRKDKAGIVVNKDNKGALTVEFKLKKEKKDKGDKAKEEKNKGENKVRVFVPASEVEEKVRRV